MRRVEAARPLRLANAAFARSAALNRFGRAWLDAWRDRKQALGLLDFDDLIDRAEALLALPGTAAWVLWRLDGGLDHILVDEAQDTSPAQWRVIEAISEEFFAGDGGRDTRRTIFVVGDEKQSIYSFQGADPLEFGARCAHYDRVLTEIGSELQRCDLLYSFRSARPILELVDAVFGGPAGQGLAQAIAHHAIDPEKPGRVELWPFLPKPEKPDEGPWDQPVDARAPDDPIEVLARRIAREIAGWLASRRALPGDPDGRAIRAGDVMILVQRRADLFHAIIRALKRERVPVAGADLLRIGGELAVNDLLAALRVAATPGDDLSLAALLRSPLGGMSERELFELAHPRQGSLRRALREAAARALARGAGARRRPAGAGRLPAALRDADPHPRPPRRAAEAHRPARRRGRGRHRRAARPGARLRGGRGAEPDRLPRLDRPRRGGGEAADGGGGRPGPGDDRARRQGPRGADRDPARHRRPPGGAQPAAGRAARRRPAGLAGEGRGSPARARRRREGAPRPGPGREPPAPLRRADPGEELARRLRRRPGIGERRELARPRPRGDGRARRRARARPRRRRPRARAQLERRARRGGGHGPAGRRPAAGLVPPPGAGAARERRCR